MFYSNALRIRGILGRMILFGLLFIFASNSIISEALATPSVGVRIYDGYTWHDFDSSSNYTPNTNVATVGVYSESDGSVTVYSEAKADYRSLGVWAYVNSQSSVIYQSYADASFGEDFYLTGGTIGSTVGLSWLISTSGFITGSDTGVVYDNFANANFNIYFFRFYSVGTEVIRDDFYWQAPHADGFFSENILTPQWNYEIGKNYRIYMLVASSATATNSFAEISSINTSKIPGVDIFTEQLGINVVTESGKPLDVYFNSDNPFASVPEPTTMLLLGLGLIGLAGVRRRMGK